MNKEIMVERNGWKNSLVFVLLRGIKVGYLDILFETIGRHGPVWYCFLVFFFFKRNNENIFG